MKTPLYHLIRILSLFIICQIQLVGQNVGIGTSTPSAKLHLQSTIQTNTSLVLDYETGSIDPANNLGDNDWYITGTDGYNSVKSAKAPLIFNSGENALLAYFFDLSVDKEITVSFDYKYDDPTNQVAFTISNNGFSFSPPSAPDWKFYSTSYTSQSTSDALKISVNALQDEAFPIVHIDNIMITYEDGHVLKIEDGTEADGYFLQSDELGQTEWYDLRGELNQNIINNKQNLEFDTTQNALTIEDGNTVLISSLKNDYGKELKLSGSEIVASNGMSLHLPSVNSSSSSFHFDAENNTLDWGLNNAAAKGSFSTRWGNGNTASNSYDTSWGEENVSSGGWCTSWGQLNWALGQLSTSWGYLNTISGQYSTAWGRQNEIDEIGGTAWGILNTSSGLYSTVWGNSNEATEENSTSFGANNHSSGSNSTSWGSGNNASTNLSSVWGQGNNSMGIRSTAWGNINQASGENSTSFGEDNTSSGELSTSWGEGNIASGSGSTVWGKDNNIAGTRGTVWGTENTGNGLDYTVWGYNNTVSSFRSTSWGTENFSGAYQSTTWGKLNSVVAGAVDGTAWGSSNNVDGVRGTAWGIDNTASGGNSTAWGDGNTANGSESTSWGYNNTVDGYRSTVWGGSNHVMNTAEYASACGTQNTAKGVGSFVTGFANSASTYLEVAIGRFNYSPDGNTGSWDSDDQLFSIGDGTSFSNESNAFVVLKNGNIGIGKNIPTYDLHLVNDSAAKPGSGSWTVSSDRRLKKDITEFTDGLDIISAIEPVWFTYNGLADISKETYVGTIAQDLEEVAPYMVSEFTHRDDEGNSENYKAVNYGAMDFVLINAIKEQQAIIQSQQETIANQQAQIDEILKTLNKSAMKAD